MGPSARSSRAHGYNVAYGKMKAESHWRDMHCDGLARLGTGGPVDHWVRIPPMALVQNGGQAAGNHNQITPGTK